MVCAQTRKKEEKMTGVGARRTGQRKGTLNCSPLLGYHEVGDGPASGHPFLVLVSAGIRYASYFPCLLIGSINVKH